MQNTRSRTNLTHMLHVVLYRAIGELRAEASRTYAGYLWWIIQPLMMFGVYFIAFNFVMGNRKQNFAIFLFTGIVLWQWFAVSVQRCAGSLIAARALMQQVDLHKSVFPFSIILVNSIKFCVTLLILIIVLQFGGFTPGPSWLLLPIVLLVELLVIASFGLFAAMISPFIPDFQLILMTVLNLAFFLSGIIYDLSDLPDRLHAILRFNPMAIVISEARSILMENRVPDFSELLIPLSLSFLLIGLSLGMLHRFDKVYPKLS